MGTDRNTGIGRNQLKDYTLKRQDLSPDGLAWQEPVIDKDLTTPPGSPSEDDRYLVISGGSGSAWAGHDNDIAHYHSGQWNYYTPIEGWFVWINDENKLYRFDGTSWAEFAGGGGSGDMLKSTYDIDTDGIVDKAESVDDGAGNASTAVDVKDAVTKKHTRLHNIDATLDHNGVSGAITDNFISFDSNGLPKDSGKKDSNYAKITTGITIDGGGEALETGYKGFIRIPYACTITKVTLLADVSGSIVIDIWKDIWANYPPTDADSITASAPPTLSSAIKSEDATLSGWTTNIVAGDVISFNVDSVSTITKVVLILEITKT